MTFHSPSIKFLTSPKKKYIDNCHEYGWYGEYETQEAPESHLSQRF